MNNWFINYRPNPRARIRLFCFPYAGGSPSVFRHWPDSLRADAEMLAVQAPGRGARISEPPIASMPTLVQQLCDSIAPLLDRPYVYFGHSCGALVAFELARRLQQLHYPGPEHVVLSARRAPHLPPLDPPVASLPDTEFLEVLRTYGAMTEDVLADRDLLALVLPTLRADIALLETHVHRPVPKLSVPATILGGTSDPLVPQADLRAWQDLISAPVRFRMIEGGHFFLKEVPGEVVGCLDEILLSCMPHLPANASSCAPKA